MCCGSSAFLGGRRRGAEKQLTPSSHQEQHDAGFPFGVPPQTVTQALPVYKVYIHTPRAFWGRREKAHFPALPLGGDDGEEDLHRGPVGPLG
jgi:hypothetical protein